MYVNIVNMGGTIGDGNYVWVTLVVNVVCANFSGINVGRTTMKIELSDDEFDTLVYSSFCYALGRRSYIVGSVTDLLIKYKGRINGDTKVLMVQRINDAIRDQQAGMNQDVVAWEAVSRAFISGGAQ